MHLALNGVTIKGNIMTKITKVVLDYEVVCVT